MKKQMDHMSQHDMIKRLMMLDHCGYNCYICGYPFASLACITYEHIVPRSLGGRKIKHNVAPSHYACNVLRQSDTIECTRYWLTDILEEIGELAFRRYINQPVPNREVMYIATLSPQFVRKCFGNQLENIYWDKPKNQSIFLK